MYMSNNQLGHLQNDIRVVNNSDLVIVWGGNPLENQQAVGIVYASKRS